MDLESGRGVHADSSEPPKHEPDRPSGVAGAAVRREDVVAKVGLAGTQAIEIWIGIHPPNHLLTYDDACRRLRMLVARPEPSTPLIVPARKQGRFILRLERSKGDLTVAENPLDASRRDCTHPLRLPARAGHVHGEPIRTRAPNTGLVGVDRACLSARRWVLTPEEVSRLRGQVRERAHNGPPRPRVVQGAHQRSALLRRSGRGPP